MFRIPILSNRLSCCRHASALTVAAILTTGLATITTNCADPDLWGHVQYGREVLRDGVLPKTATWTYAAEGVPWINHENIAEFLLAGTVDALGTIGLPWLKLSLATLICGLMIVSARKSGAGWMSIGILVVVVAANVQFHWHFRPQILTYTCLAVMLTVWQHVFHCRGCFLTGRMSLQTGAAGSQPSDFADTTTRLRRLWLLPPLMCFWANSHGGFAAGLAILGVFHAVIGVQSLWRNGLTDKRILMTLALITAASFAATLLNPYGIGLWHFMLDALKLPRPEIADWRPLEFWSRDAANFWLLIAIVTMSLGLDRRRLMFPQVLILGLLLWQGVSHCRHLSIFAIVCGFWVPRHLDAVFETVRKHVRVSDDVSRSQRRALIRTVLLTGIVVVNVGRLAPKMGDVLVDRSEYPVAAMQFFHDKSLHGRVLVTFNWAQYAIGCFSAEGNSEMKSRVAVDGRFETCYPREITDICFDFWLGPPDSAQRYRSPLTPPFDTSRALNLHQPDLVLVSRTQQPSIRTIQNHSREWVLLYQDSMAQLWGRRSKYDDPESHDFLAATQRQIGNDRQIGSVSWPALPKHRATSTRMALHDTL